jgi:conjugative transfer signal peptidase TraF
MERIQWLLLILFGLIVLNLTHILYFNIFTHSLPSGIYMKMKGDPKEGDYAASCLTQEIAQYGINRGYLVKGICDTGSVLVLKKIKALPGEHFEVRNGSFEINGHGYPMWSHDSSGRTLKVFYKQIEGVLGKGQYILLSDFVKNSWDSRYWGPVGIQFLLKPLWIFESYK